MNLIKKTKSSITSEEFENWKNDCRKEFADEPDSMNMINLFLKQLDKNQGKDEEKVNRYDACLLEFYENELCHAGELFCDKCQNNMEVYYTVHCFNCNKPPIVKDSECNYLMMTKWLNLHDEEFNGDGLWFELFYRDILKKNDSFIKLELSNDDDEYGRNVRIIAKHYDIENIKWFVSW